jgi:hypothetical protein
VHVWRVAARHHRLRRRHRRRVRPGVTAADPHRHRTRRPIGAARLHPQHRDRPAAPAGTPTQSLATPAVGALELAREKGHAWLYLNPAGPTCALSGAEIDFALRNPNHAALKEALARHAAGDTDRATVAAPLRPDSALLVAVFDSSRIRTLTHPDGTTSVCAFTSAPEVLAFSPADAAAALTTEQVLDTARRGGHSGIVINPAGPSFQLSLNEIAA